MIYRKWGQDQDVQYGHGQADYWKDAPEGVAQAVVSRLRLLAGEWFLDLREGTHYVGGVWGKHTQESFDPVIRARILETEGVTEIVEYESLFDGESRKLTVKVTIETIYGQVNVQEVL